MPARPLPRCIGNVIIQNTQFQLRYMHTYNHTYMHTYIIHTHTNIYAVNSINFSLHPTSFQLCNTLQHTAHTSTRQMYLDSHKISLIGLFCVYKSLWFISRHTHALSLRLSLFPPSANLCALLRVERPIVSIEGK